MSITVMSSTSGSSNTPQPIVPLTAVFTPPAWCSERFFTAWDPSRQPTYTREFEHKASSCYPYQFSLLWYQGLLYSPGVCPLGWSARDTTNYAHGTVASICCPSYANIHVLYCFASADSPQRHDGPFEQCGKYLSRENNHIHICPSCQRKGKCGSIRHTVRYHDTYNSFHRNGRPCHDRLEVRRSITLHTSICAPTGFQTTIDGTIWRKPYYWSGGRYSDWSSRRGCFHCHRDLPTYASTKALPLIKTASHRHRKT